MTFSVADFSAELNSTGVIKLSSFDVTIFGPSSLDNDFGRQLQLRCLDTELPGRGAVLMENNIFGVPRKIVATSNVLNELNLRFIMSEKMSERDYFEKWLDIILGNYRNEDSSEMFLTGFYADYIGNIEITNYNDKGEKVLTTKILEAFPLNVGNIQMTWSDNAQIMIFPVTFTFRHYKNETLS